MLNKKIPFFAMLMHSVFCMEYDTNVVNMSRNAELPEQMLDVCNYGISVDSRHNDSENINFNSYRGIINDDNDNVSINNVNITDNLVIDDNNLGRRMNFNICNSFLEGEGRYIFVFLVSLLELILLFLIVLSILVYSVKDRLIVMIHLIYVNITRF